MSKILEEYAAKRYAEGVRFGEQIYEQIGKHKTMLKCIKNLMQSKQLSVVEAMDALCIDENDVQASHAAVVGKLNEEHIYYLLSRGLSLADARRLISLGYLKPIEAFFEGDTRTRIEEAIERGI